MKGDDETRRTLDRLIRRERGRLVAGLVARLGGRRLELAEDVAQEAVLEALAVWPYRGLPHRPAAWLATVARNRAIDRLRRERHETVLDEEAEGEGGDATRALFEARVSDPELRLMFLCCHDALGEMDRLLLTLKLVSGFTARESAEVFLATEAAIGQRLARAKRKLRAQGHSLDEAPSRFGLRDRVPTALKVIYLMFGLGYAPRSGDALVRRDVALEAVRLARELVQAEETLTPDAHALTALVCLQASRLDAREDDEGRLVLLREQDRQRWDRTLIHEGLRHLSASRQAAALSRYHLEAGIAALHATSASWEACDWPTILGYYQQLEAMTGSPIVTLNACVAAAMAGQPEAALQRLEAMQDSERLAGYAPYFVARAEIERLLGRHDAAAADYRRALQGGSSAPVLRHLETRLASNL